MPWQRLSTLPHRSRLVSPLITSNLYLFSTSIDDSNWLVGKYKDLTPIAKSLRVNAGLRDVLEQNRVRIGLRTTDVPPVDVERQERYGTNKRGANSGSDFRGQRPNPVAERARPHRPEARNRISDRRDNVKTYWETQTPQSHHIVEFNNLEKLGVSKERGDADMDYYQLPAVLLAAEFHQRYITSILKPAQRWDENQLRAGMFNLYKQLYQGKSVLFRSLWDISQVILKEAGIT